MGKKEAILLIIPKFVQMNILWSNLNLFTRYTNKMMLET